ncbi:HAD domain-containing protein [Caldimonas tepidiphila]|uniref:HAD domain-containing protein n=1 Tax=Caldimonas tepidiphila TaxID=2315841 RepID=UPI0013005A48
MRAIFLDFDGVLHPLPMQLSTNRVVRGKPVGRYAPVNFFCWLPILVGLLESHNDVQVVVHSTWRESRPAQEIAAYLTSLGAKYVGCTIGGQKMTSIEHWLCEHPEIKSWRILDDCPLAFDPRPLELIECHWAHGISDPDVSRQLAAWLQESS